MPQTSIAYKVSYYQSVMLQCCSLYVSASLPLFLCSCCFCCRWNSWWWYMHTICDMRPSSTCYYYYCDYGYHFYFVIDVLLFVVVIAALFVILLLILCQSSLSMLLLFSVLLCLPIALRYDTIPCCCICYRWWVGRFFFFFLLYPSRRCGHLSYSCVDGPTTAADDDDYVDVYDLATAVSLFVVFQNRFWPYQLVP